MMLFVLPSAFEARLIRIRSSFSALRAAGYGIKIVQLHASRVVVNITMPSTRHRLQFCDAAPDGDCDFTRRLVSLLAALDALATANQWKTQDLTIEVPLEPDGTFQLKPRQMPSAGGHEAGPHSRGPASGSTWHWQLTPTTHP